MCCGANAQGEWSFGPRIGRGFSKNYDKEYHSTNIIGLFGEYKVNKIATELDVLFTKQGTIDYAYKCVLIPLKFKYYPSLADGFNIFAGPQLTMYKEEPGEKMIPGGGTVYNYNKTTAAIIVGLGYRSRTGLDIAINYNHGLVDVNKEKRYGKIWKERVIHVTVGYDLFQLFKIGKNR
jgi:hypothetical protein